jgi:hypothetical protein
MLSMVDCIAFSGLTGDQLDAVACYKRLPPIVAAEWAETVLESPDGCRLVETMLMEEVTVAQSHHWPCETAWRGALDEFRRQMPG